jgi:hypothetical protein
VDFKNMNLYLTLDKLNEQFLQSKVMQGKDHIRQRSKDQERFSDVLITEKDRPKGLVGGNFLGKCWANKFNR